MARLFSEPLGDPSEEVCGGGRGRGMGWRELWGCQGVGGFWNPSEDFGWNPLAANESQK